MSSFGSGAFLATANPIRGHLERQLTRLFDLLRNQDHTGILTALLRNSMCKVLDRNKFETKRSGVFAQGVLTAAEMFFVEDSQQIRVERTALTEHGKKNARQFVSSGGDSHRGAVFGTKSAKIVTQRRAAAI